MAFLFPGSLTGSPLLGATLLRRPARGLFRKALEGILLSRPLQKAQPEIYLCGVHRVDRGKGGDFFLMQSAAAGCRISKYFFQVAGSRADPEIPTPRRENFSQGLLSRATYHQDARRRTAS